MRKIKERDKWMMQEKERIAGLLNKQEECSAYVKEMAFAIGTDKQFMVKGLEAECMGTNTSVDMMMGISTFSVN